MLFGKKEWADDHHQLDFVFEILYYHTLLYICIWSFAYQEVKGVKEAKELRKLKELRGYGVKTYVLLLKKLRQKDCCLNSFNSFNSFNFCACETWIKN